MSDTTPKDQDALRAGHQPPTKARQPKPRETVCLFVLPNHHRYSIELVDDGTYGTDAQVWRDEEFSYSVRFPSRELALVWAMLERELLETRCE